MSAKNNKLVKVLMDGVVISIFVVGIGWTVKMVFKENFITDPSASFSSFMEFAGDVSGAIALKEYLTDQEILPDNV